MVHTLPPWTTKYRMVRIFGQIDSGELAARLGSINYFDRRGNVVLMDSFDDGIVKWSADGKGGRGSGVISTDYSRTRGTSLKVTTGALADDWLSINKYIPSLIGDTVGFECSLSTNESDGLFNFDVLGDDGTYLYQARTEFTTDTRVLRILDDDAGWVPLAPSPQFYTNGKTFHTFKMVFDLSTFRYKRLLVDDEVYDLSAYSLDTAATVVPNRIYLRMMLTTPNAAAQVYYLDDVILTINEP